MARSKIGKVEYQSKRALQGKNFKADTIEGSFPRASLLRKRVVQYFEDCDMNHKHYSVPGLGLFLGVRTRVIMSFNPEDEELSEHKHIIDYALQRIEAYSTERLYETKGNTKGTEFLLQNTLGYANKSDVNSKQELEVTEKQRIKSLPDEEVEGRLQRLAPKIVAITSKKNAL